MSHEVSDYFHRNVIQPSWNKQNLKSYVLSAADATALDLALRNDLRKYYYTAAISIANALHDLAGGFYSWATVELFYSVFYLNRAISGMYKDAFLYHKKVAFKVSPRAGSQPVALAGNTHEVVIEEAIASGLYSPASGQLLDSLHPFKWIERERNRVNYLLGRFAEPEVPMIYKEISTRGVRRAVTAYLISVMFQKAHVYAILGLDAGGRVL